MDRRVFVAVVVVLLVALAGLGVALADMYNVPVQHLVSFQGTAGAKVVNYTTIVSTRNFTESGIPAGALLGFEWQHGGPGQAAGIIAFTGASPEGRNAEVCFEQNPYSASGSCAWTANGESYTVMISWVEAVGPIDPADYNATMSIQGWYTYTTPAY